VSRAIETRTRVLGDEHPETLKARVFLAGMWFLRGKTQEAESLSRELLKTCKESLGQDHRVTRSARSQLTAVLLTHGKTDEAAAVYHNLRAPLDFGLKDRFQGDFNPQGNGTHVLVFWETWCPFSQRAVPKLEEYYQRYREQGLDVVGLTRVNRTATPEKVRSFIAEKHLSFPIIKTDDRAWTFFNIGGTPRVVVLRNAEMVWESYLDTPGMIPAMMFDGLVPTQAAGE
jgi:thiol-disulfide isomerase/thioredoxin